MAAAKTLSACLVGVQAQLIEVEADQRSGFVATHIVGLPDKACAEAKERVKSAVRNTGNKLPLGQFTFNLAPADLPKSGAGFDLAMAIAMLVRTKVLDQRQVEDVLFLGELALDGQLRSVPGVLAAVQLAAQKNMRACVVPKANQVEAGFVKGMKVYAAEQLKEVILHLKGGPALPLVPEQTHLKTESAYPVDLKDIVGQAFCKRALEIAAVAGHNVLLSGPPGSGKSMLAKALISLLPPIKIEEAIDITRIYSAAGLLTKQSECISRRPFRSPHHSASAVALIGGGSVPKPGEISLAHRGVLFLDELLEFPRPVLETLRQPLEDKVVSISRARQSVQFPADVLLVGAMNPCPCGYASDPERQCVCSSVSLRSYRRRLSGPLLDRIDLFLEVPRLPWKDLVDAGQEESSQAVRQRVCAAGDVLASVKQALDLKELKRLLQPEAARLLSQAHEHYQLSNRAIVRLLRVALSIAALEGKDLISTDYLAEALQYRLPATD